MEEYIAYVCEYTNEIFIRLYIFQICLLISHDTIFNKHFSFISFLKLFQIIYVVFIRNSI